MLVKIVFPLWVFEGGSRRLWGLRAFSCTEPTGGLPLKSPSWSLSWNVAFILSQSKCFVCFPSTSQGKTTIINQVFMINGGRKMPPLPSSKVGPEVGFSREVTNVRTFSPSTTGPSERGRVSQSLLLRVSFASNLGWPCAKALGLLLPSWRTGAGRPPHTSSA